MAKQNSYALNELHTMVDNTTTRIKLPLSGYLTHMDALMRVNLTTLVTGVPKQDSYARLVKGMRIKSSGARSFVDYSDGRQWWFNNWFQYKGEIQQDTLPNLAAVGPANYYALFPIHLGTFANDPFDTSIIIPAVETTDLVMEVSWGTDVDMGGPLPADWVINAADITLTIHEIALAPGEQRSLIWQKGLVMPRFEPKIIPVSASYSNLGLTSDLPVGDTLNKVVVMVLSQVGAANTRTNALVTGIGVKFPKLRETPWERSFRQFVYEAQRKYDLSAGPVTGCSQLDGMQLSGRAIGLDLTRAVTGDAQLAFTTDASVVTTGEIHLLHYLMS